jgi:glycosyltransferase involved in cell wall biosynthesis
MLVPVALLEAMWRGNTCFVSDLPHLKKLILDEQNAIIFEKNNVDDLKNKIENYSRDEKLWIQAYKFAESYPSFSNIIEEYYKLTIN